jgi:copper chaperone CopZ
MYMRNLQRHGFILISALIFIFTSCNNKNTNSIKTEVPQLARIEVSINGMTCTDCEDIIQTNIAKLDGIKTVKAVYTTGKATIEYSPEKVDTSRIRATINQTGYSVAAFLPLSLNDSIK